MMDGSKEHPILYFEEDGTGPHEHVCGGANHSVFGAREWLDRQITIGGVTAEERKAIERMLEDID